MRLIKIAEVERQLGPILRGAGVEFLDCLVQAVASDYPLRTDPHIFIEEALEGALSHSGDVGQIVDFFDFGFLENALHDLTDERDVGIGLGEPGEEECVGGVDFVVLLGGRKEEGAKGVDVWAENAMGGDDAVGEFRNGGMQEGTESARAELHSEDAGLAFESADEFVGLDSGDFGGAVFEDEVDVGMGKALGSVRIAAAEIPVDDPVVRNPRREFRGGAAAGVAQVSGGKLAAKHAARPAYFGIVDFFNFGRGFVARRRVSRFSNHRNWIRIRVSIMKGVMIMIDKSFVRMAGLRSSLWKILNGRPARVGMWLILGACTLINAQLNSVQKEAPMKKHASGTFDVKVTPQKADNKEAESSNIGRMSLDKQFHGDLDATSSGEMLSAMSEVKGSGGYVAMERVRGALHGKKGSFVLLHSGTMVGGAPQMWSVTVVPDSGTEELVGISGAMTIKIEGKNHSYEFEYSVPEKQ